VESILEKIQQFNLIRRIGQGGMAEVYLAEAKYHGLTKKVALKKILQPLSTNAHFKDTFRHEAVLSIELNHPNAVQVFEYGQTADSSHLYMIMEFVDGVDLMKLIKKAATNGVELPHGISAFIMSEVLKGLDYAHRLKDSGGEPFGLVHRDVSPQNILISYEGGIKVTDFGIAKALDRKEEKGILRGKFHYMSPEQAHAEDVDLRSDIFSAGLILYQLVTGKNPYADFKGIKALEAAKKGDIPPPSLKVDISVDLEKIISKSLSPHKEDRYQKAKDMQGDLNRYLHGLSVIYDSTTLTDLLEEQFPIKDRMPLRAIDDETIDGEHTSTRSGKSIGDSIGLTMDTHAGNSVFKESKNLVSMVVYLYGVTEAKKRIGDTKLHFELDNFVEMALNILAKERQNRYRFKRLKPNILLVVRGIPYTGEYDETELLHDAFTIRRDFKNYKDIVPELDIGIGVFRANVELIHDKQNISWTVVSQNVRDATELAKYSTNEIIVSPQIYSVAKYNWDMEELGDDLAMKKYKLLGLKDYTERRKSRAADRLVGVSFEIDRLKRTFLRVLEKQEMGHLVILGEMGVGKTSIIQSFITEMRSKAQVVRSEARPFHSAIPFSMVINFVKDMIRSHYGNAEHDFVDHLDEYLKGIIDDDLSHKKVMHTLNPLLDSSEESTKGSNINVLVASAIEVILKAMSRKTPVIAIFEDLQWSDEQSKKILQFLLEKDHFNGKVFLVFSGREEENFPEGFFKKHPLHMHNMEKSTAIKYVESHFVIPEDAEITINDIVNKAEGNPFFLKELIAATVDMGISIPQPKFGGKLILSKSGVDSGDLGLSSPTLEGIISSRLDALEPNLKSILRLAAVFGRSFKKEMLNEMIGEDTSEFIEKIIQKKILRQHGSSDKYSFIQQIVRDFAYKGIPEEEKQRAHLEIANLKIKNNSGAVAIDVPVIAGHFERGGDRKNAAKYYLQAAHHARRLGSNAEAKSHYLKVLELVPDDKSLEYHAHKDLESIYNNLGSRDGQMHHITQMDTLANEEENDHWKSEALCRRLAYHQGISELNKTIELFEKTIRTAVRAKDYYCQADAYRILARANIEMGEIEKAFDNVDKAVKLVREHSEISAIMADLLHIRGNALYYHGHMDRAIDTYKQALEMFRKDHKRTQESTILMNLGFLSAIIGSYETAIVYYKKSYNIDIEKGDRRNTGIKLANLAQTHIELGNYSSAKKLLKQAKKLCEQTRDTGALSDATLTIAQLKIRTGRYVDAMRHISNGIEYSLAAASKIDEIRGWLLYAECQLEDPEGNYNEALEKAEKSIIMSEKAEIPDALIHGLKLKARALMLMGRAEEALQYSAQAASYTMVSKIHGTDTVYHVHGLVMNALGKKYWAELFLRKAKEEVMRKASMLTMEKASDRFLAVKPAIDIILDLKEMDDNK
jgi:eukaryotic-like serine/threonine-protein kinase